MSLQEAKQFVAHFVKGDYTPEEKAIFLQWLRGATVAELNIIADEHEALHDSWPLSTGDPSFEWVERLEGKLDVAVLQTKEETEEEEEARVASIGKVRPIRRYALVAAASVVVV